MQIITPLTLITLIAANKLNCISIYLIIESIPLSPTERKERKLKIILPISFKIRQFSSMNPLFGINVSNEVISVKNNDKILKLH